MLLHKYKWDKSFQLSLDSSLVDCYLRGVTPLLFKWTSNYVRDSVLNSLVNVKEGSPIKFRGNWPWVSVYNKYLFQVIK